MKLTYKQQKFLNHIQNIGRILTDDEAVDYYVENHMTVDVSCNFNELAYYWDKKRGENPKRKDYVSDFSWDALKFKAHQWHKNIIGQLVIRGHIKLAEIGQ